MKIDGKQLASDILQDIAKRARQLPQNITPSLAVITVGEEQSWEVYVKQKEKRAAELGFTTHVFKLQGKDTQSIVKIIKQLNHQPDIAGIIVQRPLPEGINTGEVIDAITPVKDVDGFRKDSPFKPPLWRAVEYILEYIYSCSSASEKYHDWLTSQHITVLGKGETAGKPVIKGLYDLNSIPTIIDTSTSDTASILAKSDIIISGVGKRIIDAEVLKPGVILIGVGIHHEDGKLAGDYTDSEVDSIASFYTPTPGGVGRVNLAFLMDNLLLAALKQQHVE